MVVDKPSEAASFETLLPLFDGDERRTILYLQHVMGEVLTRPYEIAFKTLSEREHPLDKMHKVCRAEAPFYGAGWDIDYERPNPGLFEMKVKRCFWRDFFDRHDSRLVTTVMCAWDTNWMRAIDPAVSGLRAESHITALARRRPMSVRGAGDRRSPGRLQRQDRAAIR